jgi:uncharacterized protein (DUF2141 family)
VEIGGIEIRFSRLVGTQESAKRPNLGRFIENGDSAGPSPSQGHDQHFRPAILSRYKVIWRARAMRFSVDAARTMPRVAAAAPLLLTIFVSSSAILLAANPARSDVAGKLTVRFSGLEETAGELIVSIANSSEMFESEDQAVRSAEVPVQGKQQSVVFDGIVAGEYAVKIFHDANSNRKLDIGWRGPEEKYGFSNNVMGFMGPPDFEDAKFAFDGSELTVDIDAR